jgi:hypothetical protein
MKGNGASCSSLVIDGYDYYFNAIQAIACVKPVGVLLQRPDGLFDNTHGPITLIG